MADKPKELYCAYCQARLFEEDDVVWCPECGAPHHRACWQSLGHCARQERHGQPEPEEPDVAPEEPVEDSAPEPPQGASPFFPPGFADSAFDPYAGVDPEGEMEGLPVAEVATFVRINTRRYIPRFRRMCDTGRKVSWNVGGFLFGSIWLLYRKCYTEGFAALVATLVSYLAAVPFNRVLNQAAEATLGLLTQAQMSDPVAVGQAQTAMMQQLLATVSVWQVLLALAGAALWVAIHLLTGLFGDRIYLRRCLDKVARIREDETIDNKLQALVVAGGVHPLLAATAFLAVQFLSNYISLL